MSVSPADASLLSRETASRYAAWLRERAADPSFDPYYSEEALRFELRDDDVLAAPRDAVVSPAPCGVALSAGGGTVTVCGVAPVEARAILGAIDGVRTAHAVRLAARTSDAAWSTFVGGVFGKVVFAPAAVAALESRVSFTELVRFPGSPYEVVRAYWENAADVAERLRGLDESVRDGPTLAALMRELNVLCLVGAGGRSFYRPASPVAIKGELEPGALWLTPSVTEETSSGVRFVSGPRVNAAPIGGERYHRLLARSVDDAGALDEVRGIAEGGLDWGRVVTARADADDAAAPWFCPPRPFGDEHFGAAGRALAGALAARSLEDASRHAAAAHFRLVRLHPFVSGNQSIAMALVNRALRNALGAGIPHLVLDHLALRLAPRAYETVFARAARAWVASDPSPVRRALEYAAKRRKVFALLERLRDAGEDAGEDEAGERGEFRQREVGALLAADPDGTRLALIT